MSAKSSTTRWRQIGTLKSASIPDQIADDPRLTVTGQCTYWMDLVSFGLLVLGNGLVASNARIVRNQEVGHLTILCANCVPDFRQYSDSKKRQADLRPISRF